VLGVDTTPGQVMLTGSGTLTYPEWAVRLPVFVLSLLGQSLLFVGLRRAFGPTRALLMSLFVVLSTGWTLIMRHAMTDGPMIASLTGALGCFVAGLTTEPDKEAPSLAIELRGRVFSLGTTSLVLGAVTLLGLPQIFLLLSRKPQPGDPGR
jgi:4-amino-4-deoxy-L-arabinose transferase-like glycosyltransferase